MRTPQGMDGPFAWGDGTTTATGLGVLEKRRVTQCALSRVCGVCAEPLGRPIVFVGTPDEVGRNAFHAPPMHDVCARDLLASPGADPDWRAVSAAAFEFVRPDRSDVDPRPTFQPSVLLSSTD